MAKKNPMEQLPLPGMLGELQRNVYRAFEGVQKDQNGLSDGSYAPGSGASWADPPPSTVQEALDRLSVAAGGSA